MTCVNLIKKSLGNNFIIIIVNRETIAGIQLYIEKRTEVFTSCSGILSVRKMLRELKKRKCGMKKSFLLRMKESL